MRWPAGSPEGKGGRFAPGGAVGPGPAVEPGIGHNGGPPLESLDQVPVQTPESIQVRNRIARAVARLIFEYVARRVMLGVVAAELGPIGAVFILAMVASDAKWIYDHRWEIASFFDEPKDLAELQARVQTNRPGYDIHHIVERDQALADGYPISVVDAADNLVSIPRYRHWDVTAWYMTSNKAFKGVDGAVQSPRAYLRGRSWEERRRVGLKALKDARILK